MCVDVEPEMKTGTAVVREAPAKTIAVPAIYLLSSEERSITGVGAAGSAATPGTAIARAGGTIAAAAAAAVGVAAALGGGGLQAEHASCNWLAGGAESCV